MISHHGSKVLHKLLMMLGIMEVLVLVVGTFQHWFAFSNTLEAVTPEGPSLLRFGARHIIIQGD